MGRARRLGIVVIVLAVLAGATPAAAQYTLGGMKIEGEVTPGVRLFIEEPSKKRSAKFEEYRDLPEGVFLDRVDLRLFRPDERYSSELLGSKWGQQDQEFALRTGRLGLWNFSFDWDQTPHVFSTDSRMLAARTAPNIFNLPTVRPSLSAYNGAPVIDEIKVRWDTARLVASVTPTPDLELRAEYTRIHKDGDRPFSLAFGSPGNNFLEVVEPIDQTVHDLRLRGTFARERWQVQFGYAYSAFQNGFRGVSADNPCFGLAAPVTAAAPGCGADAAGAPPTGFISTAPNNQAHTFTLSGGVNLPLRTRLSGSGSYSLRLQNDPFLPYTINPAAFSPALTLPAKSLDGTVGVATINVNVTSHPISPLTLTVKYRLFDYDDSTKELTFPGDVVNDRTLTLGAFRVPRYNFTRQNGDADARWRFGDLLAVTGGGGWESWLRNRNRELKDSDEYFGKVALDSTWLDWLQTRLTYRPSFRRIGHYNTDSPAQAGSPDSLTLSSITLGQSLLLRKFDEADRDTQRVDLLLQVFPVDTLTGSMTGGWRLDDYIHSPLGLQNGTTWSAGADVGWNPLERVAFSAGYVHELIYQKQRSRSRPVVGTTALDFPDFDWIANNTDTVDTFSAGATVGLIPGKLDWTTNASYSVALGRQETRNPDAPVGSVARTIAAGGTAATNAANVATARSKPMPAFDDALARLETALRYHLSKNWTASFGYVFESFEKHDWRTGTLNPFVPGVTSIWLGNDIRNYTAHIVTTTLTYRIK